MFDFLTQKLNERKALGLFRSLTNPVGIDFANNDYLGLARHPEIANAAAAAYVKYGSGSRGSRLLGGNCEIFEETEKFLAKWKGTESALIFNCGYSANVGVISAFCTEGTHLFTDRLDHASIIDGYSMSKATLHRFKHNDSADLERVLKSEACAGRSLIAVESVYSMDGDIAPLEKYAELAEKYNALLYVDEAHSDGILNLKVKAHLTLTTFGKAFGCAGACVFGSKDLIDYLINFSRSFIYSTALPPGAIAAMRKSVEVAKEESWRGEKALKMAAEFREKIKKAGFDCLNSETHIVPVIMGSVEHAFECQTYLQRNDFFVAVVRPPTVPNNTARLRINITAAHTEEQVAELSEALVGFVQKNRKI
ncbi:putative 8-amino-7-oxononanoate synthase [Fibrobacterales bacterium]|nr:putative 8-amino-7-oxononanoate synthase [Fibrobacterales bacterium]